MRLKNLLNRLRELYRLPQKLEEMERRLNFNLELRLNSYANAFYKVSEANPATGNLRDIQKGLVKMLQAFEGICAANSIPYWLDYGTLLGAHRHEGFIPWDDDVDVGILRTDFEKLKKAIEKSNEFQLITWYHLKNNFDIHCKVNKFVYKDSNVKLFIDIFPYDVVLTDEPETLYSEYENQKTNLRKELSSLNMAYSFCDCYDPDDKKIIERIFDSYSYRDQDKGKATPYIIYGIENPYSPSKRIYRKEDIFPLTFLKFEGSEFPVPNNYLKYISINYEDFEKIPLDIGLQHHPSLNRAEVNYIREKLLNEKSHHVRNV